MKSFNKLKEELINKGIIFNRTGKYEETQKLHSIHEWGYIIKYDCLVLPTQYRLYDNQDQLICALDSDDDKFKIYEPESLLQCNRELFTKSYYFEYHLSDGAPIHVDNVVALLYMANSPLSDATRILLVDSGIIYIKRDGYSLKVCNIYDTEDFDEYISNRVKQGYNLLDKSYYQSNIDVFNDLIVTSPSGTKLR